MKNFIGVGVILIGVTFFLQSTGVITDQKVKDSIGSGLIMAIGIALLVWKPRAWLWPSILFLVGVTDLVENQQWPRFEEHTPWEYVWPIFIILIGLHLLLKRGKKAQTDGAGTKPA